MNGILIMSVKETSVPYETRTREGRLPEPHLEKSRKIKVPADEEDAAIDHMEEARCVQPCPLIHCGMFTLRLAV
jgi:hypothetical protein